MREVYHEMARVLEQGDPCVLATVVRTKGSTPQKPGAKLLVRKDGSGVGTLGGGCVEGDIWFASSELLKRGGDAEVKDYFLNEDLAARDGLVCGGTMYFLLEPVRRRETALPYLQEIADAYAGGPAVAVASLLRSPGAAETAVGQKLFIRRDGSTQGTLGSQALDAEVSERARALMPYGKCEFLSTNDGSHLFVEAYTTPPQLVIMGGGHIALALARLARTVGFTIHVIDDRPEFSNRERFPYAESTIVAPYDVGLAQIPVSTNTFIVIATRGHRFDDMATEAAALSPAGYVGLLGSKRKCLLIYQGLFRRGVPEERIRQIHGPVGLDLGGRTPEEIALSVMAEVLMDRLGGDGRPMRMENRLFLKAKEKALEPVAGR